MHTLTLAFETLEEIHSALTRLRSIDPIDRPDVGAPPPATLTAIVPVITPPPVQDPAAVFGGSAVVPAAPPAPAPSTAVAAPLPTAPVASPAGSPMPPVAATPSAPPAAPPAPAPAAAAAPPSPAGIEVDAKGLPWDKRIHSDTKSKNKDGTWRQKRATDTDFVTFVEGQLRAAMAAVAPLAAAAVPGISPPAPPATSGAATAGELMAALAPHMQSNRITNLTIASVLGEFQLANLHQLIARPDLVGAVAAKFKPYIDAALAAA
jgi:hypothetical protein